MCPVEANYLQIQLLRESWQKVRQHWREVYDRRGGRCSWWWMGMGGRPWGCPCSDAGREVNGIDNARCQFGRYPLWSIKVTVVMQCATLATTFGVYFAHLTSRAEEEEEQLPAALVSSVPSIMAFTMFFFCPISTALSKVLNCVVISRIINF